MALRRYWLDGVYLESELLLRNAPVADDVEPKAPGTAPPCVRILLRPFDPPPIATWEARETGVSIGRAEAGYLLRYEDEISFWVDRSGHDIACQIAPEVPHESVEQIFIDQILPLILHIQGRFSFHASAVAQGDAVIAFLGDTGRGKSTLASSLAASGGRVFSDDCLAVSLDEGLALAYPSYASTRLWPESADALFAHRGPLPYATPRTDKRRVELPWSGEPLPLRRMYLLERADGPVVIERLGRASALGAILRHVNRLEGLDRGRLEREIAFLEALVTVVPVATLAYRRDFVELPAVRAAILADATSSSADLSSPA